MPAPAIPVGAILHMDTRLVSSEGQKSRDRRRAEVGHVCLCPALRPPTVAPQAPLTLLSEGLCFTDHTDRTRAVQTSGWAGLGVAKHLLLGRLFPAQGSLESSRKWTG